MIYLAYVYHYYYSFAHNARMFFVCQLQYDDAMLFYVAMFIFLVIYFHAFQ
ncbi:hypothetical protein Lalb_Chr23g0275411 [Lupinus albus]|uniref:Uncharacterized protein n=1 Tax=Lupinus albus TaxID=3870 RepID=A0A6A4NFM6_LUPAL|nr:hypothetical protein Lalb_Chr23g0275411 [Lupinus albus]